MAKQVVLTDPSPVRSLFDERAIRKELTAIQAANSDGLLTPEQTVEQAKDPASSMHDMFTWEDDEAAHQYRLMQARALIRRFRVVMPDDKEERSVPKYISLRSDRKRRGGGYRETSKVLNNKELLAELEETAKRDIDGVLRRYEMLKALCAKVRTAAGIENKK